MSTKMIVTYSLMAAMIFGFTPLIASAANSSTYDGTNEPYLSNTTIQQEPGAAVLPFIILQQPNGNGELLPDVLFPGEEEVTAYIESQPIKNLTVLSEGNRGNISNVQAAASGSKVFVTWQDNTPGNYDIYLSVSYDGGLSFTGPVNLSNNTGNSTDPQIGAMHNDVQVLWQDDTPGNYDVFVSTSTDWGATFRTYNLSNSTTDSVSPRINTDGKYPVWLWEEEYCPPPPSPEEPFPANATSPASDPETGGGSISPKVCYDVLYAHSRFW